MIIRPTLPETPNYTTPRGTIQLQGNPQKIYATHALLPPEPADKMFTKGTS